MSDAQSPKYISLRTDFIQDLSVTFEAKGYYAGYIGGQLAQEEIPELIWAEISNWFEGEVE